MPIYYSYEDGIITEEMLNDLCKIGKYGIDLVNQIRPNIIKIEVRQSG